MFVKVLRPFINKGSDIAKEGSVIDVSIHRATELEKKGLVVPTIGGKSLSSDPFQSRQLGGQTGAEKPVPSSPVAPLLTKQILPKQKGRKSKSSR